MRDEDWLAKMRAEGHIISEATVNAARLQASLTKPGYPLDKDASEAEFQQAVIDLAHQCGAVVAHFFKMKVVEPSGFTRWMTPAGADGKGWPDLFIAIEGMKPIVAELKVKANVPTPEQWGWIRLLRSGGLDVRVWYPSDWSDIVDALTHPVAAVSAQELHRLADDGCPHHGDDAA